MDDRDDIAITGYGLITSLGIGWRANWEGLIAGHSGFGPIRRFDVSNFPISDGGEAPPLPSADREFAERAGVPAGLPFLGYLLAAAREALEMAGAGVADGGGATQGDERAGLVVGSSLAASDASEAFFRSLIERGLEGADHGALRGYYAEEHLAILARALDLAGPSSLVSNACAAGGSSVARAAELLLSGRCDRVLAVGYDALSPFTHAGFASLQALARGRTRPFGRGRDGMKLGDGYAALHLEPLSRARARGHRGDLLLLGHGESADAHHLTHPHPEGLGAALAMGRALSMARLAPEEIEYLNAHGTATPSNDAAEARALRTVFGERLPSIPINATKPNVGHTLGGAGTVEAVVTLLVLQHGQLPPTLNIEDVEEAYRDLDFVPKARAATVRCAISNSFGFGGSNASLVFGQNDRSAEERTDGIEPQRTQRTDERNEEKTKGEIRNFRLPTSDFRLPPVWITGLGLVTPAGIGTEAFSRALRAGLPPISGVSRERGPGPAYTLDPKTFRAEDHLDPRAVRRVSALSRFSLAAGKLALESAVFPEDPELRDATAVLLGTAFGSAAYHFEYYETIFRKGLKEASPLLFSESVMNAASGHLSNYFQLRGPSLTLVGGEDAGISAAGAALDKIRSGAAVAALAGGAEEHCATIHRSLASQRIVARWEEETTSGKLPFSEGAALLCLEEAGSAERRGARPLALLAGAGWGRGEASPGSPSSHASRALAVRRAAAAALADAGMAAERIDLLVCGGDGASPGDSIEARALLGAGGPLREGIELLAPGRILGEGFAFSSAALLAAAALSAHGAIRAALVVRSTEPGGASAAVITTAGSAD